MQKIIEGFIVKETPYQESSKIIQLLTKEYGIIGVIAKGAKNVKSPLRAVSTRLTYGLFNLYFKEDKLSTLISVDLIEDLSNIKTDLTLISYASYLTDLTSQIIKQEESEEVYNIFIATILKLNQNLDPQVLTNIFELKMLDYLGVAINLDSCHKCGRTNNIVTIDGDAGGYICKNCLTNEPLVSPKTIKMLRMYYYVDINSITDLKISANTKKEIDNFLTKYYDRYTGLYLKSKDFLTKIKKIL